MRLSVVLLLCSLAGILGGGALLGLPALGACLIFDSVMVGLYGLITHDWRLPQPVPLHGVPQSVEQVFDRVRAAP
jgi:hypothetical protein